MHLLLASWVSFDIQREAATSGLSPKWGHMCTNTYYCTLIFYFIIFINCHIVRLTWTSPKAILICT